MCVNLFQKAFLNTYIYPIKCQKIDMRVYIIYRYTYKVFYIYYAQPQPSMLAGDVMDDVSHGRKVWMKAKTRIPTHTYSNY